MIFALEVAIQADPDRHPVIRETGGLRKIRFAAPGSSRGKSGSYRVGYAHFPNPGLVLLLLVWAKNEKDDLSKAECHAIADALTRFESLIETGQSDEQTESSRGQAHPGAGRDEIKATACGRTIQASSGDGGRVARSLRYSRGRCAARKGCDGTHLYD